jgi:hypothetical protein
MVQVSLLSQQAVAVVQVLMAVLQLVLLVVQVATV